MENNSGHNKTLKVAKNNDFTCLGWCFCSCLEPSEINVWVQFKVRFLSYFYKNRIHVADFPEVTLKTGQIFNCRFFWAIKTNLLTIFLFFIIGWGHKVITCLSVFPAIDLKLLFFKKFEIFTVKFFWIILLFYVGGGRWREKGGG